MIINWLEFSDNHTADLPAKRGERERYGLRRAGLHFYRWRPIPGRLYMVLGLLQLNRGGKGAPEAWMERYEVLRLGLEVLTWNTTSI